MEFTDRPACDHRHTMVEGAERRHVHIDSRQLFVQPMECRCELRFARRSRYHRPPVAAPVSPTFSPSARVSVAPYCSQAFAELYNRCAKDLPCLKQQLTLFTGF